jgi:hypothetical protein
MNLQHHVVIVGAGFGGLAAAQELAGAAVRITLIDQRNHHLFQPLLYQVGTAVLATSEIAWPIRFLLRKRKEVTTWLGVVSGVDAQGRNVLLEDGATVSFDTLILATEIGMTSGRRSRPDSKPWRTPPRFAAEFCWRWSGPNASLTLRGARPCSRSSSSAAGRPVWNWPAPSLN